MQAQRTSQSTTPIIISELDGSQFSASRPRGFTLAIRASGTHWTSRCGGSKIGLDEICPCRTPHVQPVAQYYKLNYNWFITYFTVLKRRRTPNEGRKQRPSENRLSGRTGTKVNHPSQGAIIQQDSATRHSWHRIQRVTGNFWIELPIDWTARATREIADSAMMKWKWLFVNGCKWQSPILRAEGLQKPR
jgi:hypothetical protein